MTLHRECLHLAVNMIDRFLSRIRYVARGKLQLVGVAALYIASKLEEIHPPKAVDVRSTIRVVGFCSVLRLVVSSFVSLQCCVQSVLGNHR